MSSIKSHKLLALYIKAVHLILAVFFLLRQILSCQKMSVGSAPLVRVSLRNDAFQKLTQATYFKTTGLEQNRMKVDK